MGRPPSCLCGQCRKCKSRVAKRLWYRNLSPEKRREIVENRDPEKVRASDAARYYRDRPKRLALSRKWDIENRERGNQIKRAWARRNAEKIAAYSAVHRAIRAGRLERGQCEKCGRTDTHAHHEDYTRPLDVRWLCPEHHGETRRKWAA